MRILSSAKEPVLVIRSAQMAWRVQPDNTSIQVPVKSAIELYFKPYQYLFPHERLIAAQTWNGATRMDDPTFAAYGASPQPMAPTVEGGIQWHWWMNLSVYDTEWLADAEQREYTEAFMRTYSDSLFLVLDDVKPTPPWPSYDDIDDPEERKQGVLTAATRIARTTRDGGYDPSVVLAYELATKNREDVTAALEALVKEAADKRAEDAALNRMVTR